MKKLVSTVALLAALLTATSAYNDSNRALSVGDDAPELSLGNSSTAFELTNDGNEFVLLTFWSTSDAQSRVGCNAYSAWFGRNKTDKVKHISVNFDETPVLFEEIVRRDNLDKSTQYNVNGSEASQIRHDFGLENGYGSVLIDPQGKICAFNPSTSDLSALL